MGDFSVFVYFLQDQFHLGWVCSLPGPQSPRFARTPPGKSGWRSHEGWGLLSLPQLQGGGLVSGPRPREALGAHGATGQGTRVRVG